MGVLSDFRSDTVTRPGAAMRAAMAAAEVGDDVFGDDPTVIRLEAEGARFLGKEAALFFPTGTMANQCALRVHTRPGDEVILHEGSHAYRFEQGGMAALHGLQAVPLPGPGGRLRVEDLLQAIRGEDQHLPRSRVLLLENTHNLAGGTVLDPAATLALAGAARSRGLLVHLDGARLANAAVALGVAPAFLAGPADSVTLCLSKGLGAPAGTLLAGDATFIALARRARKLLGGGMRQVGVLAAAGLIALEEGPLALASDHERARRLARALAVLPGLRVQEPETNIVVVELEGSQAGFLDALRADGVLAVPFGPGRIRFTTHRDLDDGDVERAAEAAARWARESGRGALR
jgi:threonine aldolase